MGSSWPLGIFSTVPQQKKILCGHIINLLLTKFVSLTSSQSINIFIQTKHLFNNVHIVTPKRGRHLTWNYYEDNTKQIK